MKTFGAVGVILLAMTLFGGLACGDGNNESRGDTSRRSKPIQRELVNGKSGSQAIYVYVSYTATFEGPTGLWVYTYNVTNDFTSTTSLEGFAITPTLSV